MNRYVRALLIAAVSCFAVWFSLALALDRHGAEHTPDGSYDLVIVAGCRVMPDGSPSLALARRTRKAVSLYQQGVAPQVLFTGGTGTYPPSEAQTAADYARTLGLPESAILLEDASTSTEENARYGAQNHPAEQVVVVSDTYHIFRVERVFGRYYPEVEGVGSTPLLWWRVRGSLREVLAVGWYGVRGRL